jgi:hypothetical protein
MKNCAFLLLMAAFTLSSCQKSDTNQGDAKLIGIDFRKCATPYCSGWFIEINGETKRFFEAPAETDIDFSGELTFPISVTVVWEKYDNEWQDVEDLVRVKKIFYND